MRICPTCGDPVAGTPRWCPRCSAPLPEPGTAAGPGTVTWPGIVTWSGYPEASGYRPDSGYPAEPGYPTGPEYPTGPAYPAERVYPAEPGNVAGSEYLAAPGYPPPYLPAPYQPAPGQPGFYEPRHDEPDPYEPAPYGDDPGRPEAFGDLFAGGGPETGGFRARPAAEPEMDPGQEDTASRLLYSPPRPPRRPPRRARGHRAQITSAALAAVALLVGGLIAWAAFGQHQAGPGSQLAGRQTTAARRASPAPTVRAVPSPAPLVPAPGGVPAVVTMAPGMSQAPDAAQVDGFLVSYFTAINAHDYQQYERLLIPARRVLLTAADFTRGYGTTTDTGASIVGISPTADGVAVTVTFTSQQQAAPDGEVSSCTYWDITLYLQKQAGTLLIGNPPPGYHAYHRSCP